jgi:hypothetical protein
MARGRNPRDRAAAGQRKPDVLSEGTLEDKAREGRVESRDRRQVVPTGAAPVFPTGFRCPSHA